MSVTVNQVINQALQFSYGHSLTYTSSVAAGDFLYIILSSSAYSTNSGVITAVSDNVNGSWTILDNSGVITNGTSNLTGVFAYCANSAAAAANALTVTVTGSGQDFDSVGVDLSGVSTASPIVGHSMNTSTTLTGSSPYSFTTPSVTDTSSGDFVIGWASGYYNNDPFAAGTGATLDSSYNGANEGLVGAFHLTANSVSGSNSVNATLAGNAVPITGTVIVARAPVPNTYTSTWVVW